MTTLFVDMDGVVSDFEGYANQLIDVDIKPGYRFSQAEWERLRIQAPRIYRHLEVLPSARELISELKAIRDEYAFNMVFLTAVPHENDMPWAYWDKIEWACKHFPGIPVWFGPYSHDKQHHHKPGDILIDDRISNISEWPGLGILHDHTKIDETLMTLRRYIY